MQYFFLAFIFFIAGFLLMIACWDIVVSEYRYRKTTFKTWWTTFNMKRRYKHVPETYNKLDELAKISWKMLWSKREEESL